MPKAKKTDDVSRSAEDVLADLASNGLKIGLGIPEQEWWSTGNMAIDTVSGGGLPIGRVVTLAGPQASGKTTTAVSTGRSVIESGRRILFCDYERTLNKTYFRSLGVDPEDTSSFVRFNPRTLEEGFDAIRELSKTGDFGLTIVDSIPAMMTNKERTGNIESGMNLELPKLLRAALKQANDYCFDSDMTLVLLNHLMEKVDITFMGQKLAAQGIKQYTMPGGTGPLFYSSLILYFKKLNHISVDKVYDSIVNEETKQKIGWRHSVTVAKNKVAKPDGVTEVINILGEGFSNQRTALEVLKAHGAVRKAGSWYSVREPSLVSILGDKQVQGEETFYAQLFDNVEARGQAITLARGYLQQAYDDLESSPDSDDNKSLEYNV